MFYRRQLSTYNYCLYDGRTRNGTMALWTETEGHRGVDEVGSVVLQYVRDHFEPLGNGQMRSLIFYCDRCRGQTNNYQILCLFKVLIQLGYFTQIEQKLMPTGHSYLPCDRLFGLIEQRKKPARVIVPNHWRDLIRSTAVANPFPIQRMNQLNIFDVKALERSIPRPATLRVSEAHVFRMSAATPSLIQSRRDYLDQNWTDHTIRRPMARGRIINRPLWSHNDIQRFVFQVLYRNLIPITWEKYADLQAMLPCIMPEYRAYYINLPHLPRPNRQ
jgi:hypothetical protein